MDHSARWSLGDASNYVDITVKEKDLVKVAANLERQNRKKFWHLTRGCDIVSEKTGKVYKRANVMQLANGEAPKDIVGYKKEKTYAAAIELKDKLHAKKTGIEARAENVLNTLKLKNKTERLDKNKMMIIDSFKTDVCNLKEHIGMVILKLDEIEGYKSKIYEIIDKSFSEIKGKKYAAVSLKKIIDELINNKKENEEKAIAEARVDVLRYIGNELKHGVKRSKGGDIEHAYKHKEGIFEELGLIMRDGEHANTYAEIQKGFDEKAAYDWTEFEL